MVSNEIIGVIVLASVAFVIIIIYLCKCLSDCMLGKRKGASPSALTDEDIIQISLESRADPIPNDAYDMGGDTSRADHNDFNQVCRSLEVAARKEKFQQALHPGARMKGYIPLASPPPDAPELGIESDDTYDVPRHAQQTYDVPTRAGGYPISPTLQEQPQPFVFDASVIVHQPRVDPEEHLYAPIIKSPCPPSRSETRPAVAVESDAPTYFPPRSLGDLTASVPPSIGTTESSDSVSVTTGTGTAPSVGNFDTPPIQETYDVPPHQLQETYDVPPTHLQETYDVPPHHQEVYDVPPFHQEANEVLPFHQETYDTPTSGVGGEENTAPNNQRIPVNSVFFIPDDVELDEEEEEPKSYRRQRRNSTRSIKTLDDLDLNGKPKKKKGDVAGDGTPKAKKKRKKSVAEGDSSTPKQVPCNFGGEKNTPFSNLTPQPSTGARTYQF